MSNINGAQKQDCSTYLQRGYKASEETSRVAYFALL